MNIINPHGSTETSVAALTRQNLLLDCDGVLLNWLGGFIRYAQHKLKRRIDPAGPSDFNLSEWLGVPEDVVLEMIEAFNSGEGGYFGQLEPEVGAIEALHKAHAQGRYIDIITACSKTPKVIAQRKQNLITVYGDIFRNIHAVDHSESKQVLLSGYSDVIWVEDRMENAVMGAELGLKTYLVRASHNAKHDGLITHPNMTWVDGWDCIRQHEALH